MRIKFKNCPWLDIQLDITPNEEVKLIIPVVYKLTF